MLCKMLEIRVPARSIHINKTPESHPFNQIGSSELTLVNLHLPATPLVGEQKEKNGSSDELKAHRLNTGIQENLKGT